MGRLGGPLPVLCLQLRQPLPSSRDPRLEFGLVEQSVAVRVNQSGNHSFHITRQLAEMLHLLIRSRLGPSEPPLVLLPDTLRLGQETTHVFPDGGVQHIGPDLLVPTEALAAEAVGVRACAAVVGVRDPAPGSRPSRPLTVASVAAPLAHDQALEQVTASARPVAPATSVLLELSPNHSEELFAHQRGYVDENVIILRCIDRRDRAPGQIGSASLGTEPLRLELPRARLAERRLPLVRGVFEEQPDRRPVPRRFTFPRGDALVTQAPADLTDRAPLLADPLKDLPHDPGLFGQDPVPRRASPLVLVDVTVAVGARR